MELFTVKNEEGLVVCSITYDRVPANGYDDSTVIVRDKIKSRNAVEIADMILNFIDEHAGDYMSETEFTLKFAFPFYGGAVMNINFTGANLDNSSAAELREDIAAGLMTIACKYFTKVYGNNEVLNKRLESFMPGLKAICKNGNREIVFDESTAEIPVAFR